MVRSTQVGGARVAVKPTSDRHATNPLHERPRLRIVQRDSILYVSAHGVLGSIRGREHLLAPERAVPPRPIARASAAAVNRRVRSLSCGRTGVRRAAMPAAAARIRECTEGASWAISRAVVRDPATQVPCSAIKSSRQVWPKSVIKPRAGGCVCGPPQGRPTHTRTRGTYLSFKQAGLQESAELVSKCN